jgi:paraquat-inducible protein B
VSGLRTIVLGNYITVQPGNGARTNIFIGAEKEPIEPIQALDILLLAPKLDSLQPQSPVFYRGIQVGEVLDCRLSDDARKVSSRPALGRIRSAGADEFKILECRRH